jgi:hypothetical protein
MSGKSRWLQTLRASRGLLHHCFSSLNMMIPKYYWCSSVCDMTDLPYWLDARWLSTSISQCPERLYSLRNHILRGCQRIFPRVKAAGSRSCSFTSNAEVKNTQSCTSTPCIRLRDMVSVKESLPAAHFCPFKEWHPSTLWRMTLI